MTDGKSLLMTIEGMHCQNCAEKVRDALAAVPGVASADVDLKGNSARVAYDPQAADTARIAAAVTAAGFKVKRFMRV
jgi:Cu+-exporting ATPase